MKTKWIKQEIKGKTLEWGKVSPHKMKWEQAKIWCEKQGGRLPTSAELLHAYEQKVEGFGIAHYWTGTPLLHTTDSGLAKCVFFHFGWVSSERKTTLCYVRCVRDVK
jgi:hypothetical protein